MDNPDGKKKFSHTRELVKIAIDDGLSQTEISRMCRTSQSVVSGWLNGTSRAKLTVIRPLVERYGNRLSRVHSRYYIVEAAQSNSAPWRETELGERIGSMRRNSLSDDDRSFLRNLLKSNANDYGISQDDVILCAEQELDDRDRISGVVRVEGPVVFRHIFRSWIAIEKSRRTDLEPIATGRCIVHHVSSNQFQLVVQRRRELRGRALFAELLNITAHTRDKNRGAETGDSFARRLATWRWVDCVDDEGRWIATVEGPLELTKLLASIDRLADPESLLASPSDSTTLPLLARKALMQLGYTL